MSTTCDIWNIALGFEHGRGTYIYRHGDESVNRGKLQGLAGVGAETGEGNTK